MLVSPTTGGKAAREAQATLGTMTAPILLDAAGRRRPPATSREQMAPGWTCREPRASIIGPMPGVRATRGDRERAARRLRGSWLAGAVSTDTFEARLGLALKARRRDELRALTRDLPAQATQLGRRLRAWLDEPRPASELELSLAGADGRRPVVLGRHRSCDRVYDDLSVSRRHALLCAHVGGWALHDVGSLNGTWVNGLRVDGSEPVREGDVIQIGAVRLVLADVPPPVVR